MPWDVLPNRQLQLLTTYGFQCGCSLCIGGCAGLESLVCPQCGKELRPGHTTVDSSGDIVSCSCGGSIESEAMYSGAVQASKHLSMLESKYVSRCLRKSRNKTEIDMTDIFNELTRLLDTMASVFHPNHIILFRLRALIVKVASKHPCTGDQEPSREGWVRLETRILSCLEAMDITAIHIFDSCDLIRQPMLLLRDKMLQNKAIQGNSRTRKQANTMRKRISVERAAISAAHNNVRLADL